MTVTRVPFTPEDEGAIRTLTGAMTFLLVVNFIFGGLGVLGGCCSFVGVPARIAIHPLAGLGAGITALGVLLYCAGMVGQGALLMQMRRLLTDVVTSDNQDQALLGQAFHKLRFFFTLEAALFLVGMFLQTGTFLTQAFGPVGQIMRGSGM